MFSLQHSVLDEPLSGATGIVADIEARYVDLHQTRSSTETFLNGTSVEIPSVSPCSC
jgi:hypothetical protein